MQIRPKTLILLAIALGAVGGGWYLANRYVADTLSPGRLLAWSDDRRGVQVELVDPHIAGTDITLVLGVTRDGRRREELVLEKSGLGTLSFVLYNDRLLVLNDKYVFAAYDLAADRIVQTAGLPFTLYQGQGRRVCAASAGEVARMPSDFPLKADPEWKPPASAPAFRIAPQGR
ncbi:MAG: hypothetical protein NTV86_12000 [Planctomycetota bacterium]|nr:hypothetical protein [Planctomycetota bacterium]